MGRKFIFISHGLCNNSIINLKGLNTTSNAALHIQDECGELNTYFAVVNWDTKLLSDATVMEKQDRLPDIVKRLFTEELLGVSHISSGSGNEMSC